MTFSSTCSRYLWQTGGKGKRGHSRNESRGYSSHLLMDLLHIGLLHDSNCDKHWIWRYIRLQSRARPPQSQAYSVLIFNCISYCSLCQNFQKTAEQGRVGRYKEKFESTHEHGSSRSSIAARCYQSRSWNRHLGSHSYSPVEWNEQYPRQLVYNLFNYLVMKLCEFLRYANAIRMLSCAGMCVHSFRGKTNLYLYYMLIPLHIAVNCMSIWRNFILFFVMFVCKYLNSVIAFTQGDYRSFFFLYICYSWEVKVWTHENCNVSWLYA